MKKKDVVECSKWMMILIFSAVYCWTNHHTFEYFLAFLTGMILVRVIPYCIGWLIGREPDFILEIDETDPTDVKPKIIFNIKDEDMVNGMALDGKIVIRGENKDVNGGDSYEK